MFWNKGLVQTGKPKFFDMHKMCTYEYKSKYNLLLFPGNRNALFCHDVIRDTGWHVRQWQPEKLGVPARGVAGAGPDCGHSVLHAADHLHQISITDLGNFV